MGLLIKLKNGDTSFKSLKFGKDRPGGGDSGKPYIQTPIGDQAENTAIDGDGIIRGGLTAPSRALEDVTRLSKYFFDFKNPNGLLFTAKQNLLSRIATKTEAAIGLGYGGSKSRTVLGQGVTSDGFTESNGVINGGIYTPLSTLGQAAVGFTGTHLDKQGLDPTGKFPDAAIKKYGDVVFERNKASRNGEGPIRSIIPFNLIRKEQRANTRLENATLQQSNAEDRAIDEQNREASQTSLFTRNIVVPKISTSLNYAANSFLKKWDEYRNQQAQKKLDRKTANLEKAQAQKDLASENVGQSYEDNFQEIYYDNRLLNLWNSQGLDITKAYEGQIHNLASGGILYSYGGGPNSIAGVGQTNIRFSTLNDGISPARTGAFRIDPYFKEVDKDTSLPVYEYGKPINRPLVYSLKHIFSNNTVSLLYQLNNPDNPLITGEKLFGEKNYLIDKDNSEDIQPWDSNRFIRSNTRFFNDIDSFKSVAATWNYGNFASQEFNKTGELKESFTKRLVASNSKSFIAKSPDYLKENQERRVNIGRFNDPGQKGNVSDYTKGKKDSRGKVLGPTDRINALPIVTRFPDDDFYNDFIRFRISTLNLTGGKQHLFFRAFLDDLGDDYSAKWNTINYIGRGENFYKYQGFDRSVNVGFTLAALSKQELLPMYKKLNFLASTLAPSYTDAGYMAGNISELTVGDWFYQQPGIIESLSISIPDDSPWDIQIPVEGKSGGDGIGSDFSDIKTKELPFMLKVKMKFTPIHKFLPQKQRNRYDKRQLSDSKGNMIDGNKYGPERYIALGINGDGYGKTNKITPVPPPATPTLEVKNEIPEVNIASTSMNSVQQQAMNQDPAAYIAANDPFK